MYRTTYKKKRAALIQPRGVSYRFIPLTKGQITVVDEEDYDRLAKFNWTANWDKDTNTYYAARECARNKTEIMHRTILNITDSSIDVDHKDHDGLNNRKENLRLATRSQNKANSRLNRNNTSGYKGVQKSGNKWCIQICYKGKYIHLGGFKTKEDAYEVYLQKAKELFGEFAYGDKKRRAN